MERSPLLAKAEAFLKAMGESNERMRKELEDGADPAQYNMEVLEPGEEEYIEMEIIPGVLELNTEDPYVHEEDE